MAGVHKRTRSLRVGPTYLASTRDHIRIRQPRDIGRRVAHAVGGFRHRDDRNPMVGELAFYIRTANGRPLFRSEAELVKSFPWLAMAGWIRV